jgi:hypothetical protein
MRCVELFLDKGILSIRTIPPWLVLPIVILVSWLLACCAVLQLLLVANDK